MSREDRAFPNSSNTKGMVVCKKFRWNFFKKGLKRVNVDIFFRKRTRNQAEPIFVLDFEGMLFAMVAL